MDTDLLDQGFAWSAARLATVPADGLDLPTPCGLWSLRELLDHTVETLALLTDAVAPSPATPGPPPWAEALADVAARSRRAWSAPGVMDVTYATAFGAMPGPVLASATLLEAVVHGWDVSQATGEAAAIPDHLARPVLDFARQAIGDGDRGDVFAADLGCGDTPSDQLVAYLGRKPL